MRVREGAGRVRSAVHSFCQKVSAPASHPGQSRYRLFSLILFFREISYAHGKEISGMTVCVPGPGYASIPLLATFAPGDDWRDPGRVRPGA